MTEMSSEAETIDALRRELTEERARRVGAERTIHGLQHRCAALETATGALHFYADPETYHAIMFMVDRPAGGFADDFSDDHGDEFYNREMPGAAARAALKAIAPDAPQVDLEPLEFDYTNWEGKHSRRRAVPSYVWYGSTTWHPDPQWLMTAHDLKQDASRDFAMADIGAPAPEKTDFLTIMLGDGANPEAVATGEQVPNHVVAGDAHFAANPVQAEIDRLRPHYLSGTATDIARRQMLDHFEKVFCNLSAA